MLIETHIYRMMQFSVTMTDA